MSSSDSFGAMMKRAFKWHWNLLGLGAGVIVGILSGQPGIVLPIVAAAEIAYLGFCGSNARFQNVLKGRKMLENARKDPMTARTESSERLAQLIDFLAPVDVRRFESLRERCSELTRLQKRMKSERGTISAGGASFRTESLDKLLWLFLKLLHRKTGIDRFLQYTDRDQLAQDRSTADRQLEDAKSAGRSERLIGSLGENAQTIADRIHNYDQAVENGDIVNAELDKTEQKITHICEVGMTSTDATDLSARIDGLTKSMATSERAIDDLDLADILGDNLAPPPLIDLASEKISFLEEPEMN